MAGDIVSELSTLYCRPHEKGHWLPTCLGKQFPHSTLPPWQQAKQYTQKNYAGLNVGYKWVQWCYALILLLLPLFLSQFFFSSSSFLSFLFVLILFFLPFYLLFVLFFFRLPVQFPSKLFLFPSLVLARPFPFLSLMPIHFLIPKHKKRLESLLDSSLLPNIL